MYVCSEQSQPVVHDKTKRSAGKIRSPDIAGTHFGKSGSRHFLDQLEILVETLLSFASRLIRTELLDNRAIQQRRNISI